MKILFDKKPEEEQLEIEIEQKIYYDKLYKTFMCLLVDNTSEQERKDRHNQYEWIRREDKKFLLILIDDVPKQWLRYGL